jgi:PAS domain S-box-containing protein
MEQIHAYRNKLTVVVVEDNIGDFVLIEDYLLDKFEQIEILHFTDYASSMSYLVNTQHHVSIILLDLHLPDKQSIALIQSFLEHSFRIPVIILTGYADIDMAKKSLQIGAYDYLIKDELNPALLHKTIVFALNRSQFVNQIEDEKRNYVNLFNFSPQPTWLLETHSLKIMNANIAAQKKYGYTLDTFLKMTFSDLHPKEEQIIVKSQISTKEFKNQSLHFTHFLSNGHEIKVDIYSRKFKSITNHAFIVQSNDVSETLKRIQTIEDQNEKLRKIAWTQSHVVRAPIARALGIINLLQDQPEHLQDITFWLNQLKISTFEMDDIVKQIVQQSNQIEE